MQADVPTDDENDEPIDDTEYISTVNVPNVTEPPKEENLVLAFSNRRKPYFPLKKDQRLKLMRDLVGAHRWQDAAKWLSTLIDDISVPHDLLYRYTMILLEANKPTHVSFQFYYSRTVSPLVKSFLTMDLNKREVLLDVCTLLCRNGLFKEARQFLEENNRILRNVDSQGEVLSHYRVNETIDTCVILYKVYLGYIEWLSEVDDAFEYLEQLRESRARNLITLLRSALQFSESFNVDIFVQALQEIYDYYGFTNESLELWSEFSSKCPRNLFAIIGYWQVLNSLVGPFEEQRFTLLEKLGKLDPSHPMILTMIKSGRLGKLTNDMLLKFVVLLMEFVDYGSNEGRKKQAWELLLSLIEQMDVATMSKVRALYFFKYKSYWEYTHLKEPRGHEEEVFVRLVLQSS